MGYLKTILGLAVFAAMPVASALEAVPAELSAHAAQAMLLGAAWAKERVVAVGDHGVVLVSDDQGRSYARRAPYRCPAPDRGQLRGCQPRLGRRPLGRHPRHRRWR
jgi:hypothetical protein